MEPFDVRALTPDDRGWVARFIAEHWGDEIVVAHGEVYQPAELPGFVAERGRERLGLITYRLAGDGCEVMSLDSLLEGHGIGTALIEAVADAARAAGCRRLYLTTTNDNLNALRFYQKRGLRLAALRPGAVDESRLIKASIPAIGEHGIPLRDELELTLEL